MEILPLTASKQAVDPTSLCRQALCKFLLMCLMPEAPPVIAVLTGLCQSTSVLRFSPCYSRPGFPQTALPLPLNPDPQPLLLVSPVLGSHTALPRHQTCSPPCYSGQLLPVECVWCMGQIITLHGDWCGCRCWRTTSTFLRVGVGED